jgi:hypothetical protein
MSALGLSDAELLDLTLTTALFSALAIIEPISAVVAPVQILQPSSNGAMARPECGAPGPPATVPEQP